MDKKYKLEDFTQDSFLHGTIEQFSYNPQKKYFQIVFSYMNFESGGCLYECTITITDWWNFDVTEEGTGVLKKYDQDHIPLDIEQIFEYHYDGTTLILKACGYSAIDSVVYYKFTNPKIQITGEYDPD